MAFRALIGIAIVIALLSLTPVANSQECYNRDAFFEAVKHPETVLVMPLEHWAAFALEAGVTADDFAILQDS